MTSSLPGDSATAPQPLPASPRNRTNLKIAVTMLSLLVVVGGPLFGARAWWGRYVAKFNTIDKTRESLSWEPSESQPMFTIYANPVYGVSLNLPGQWVRIQSPYKSFCTLIGSPDAGSDHFDVMFSPIFPALSLSIDADANAIRDRYNRQGWTLQSEESIRINGKRARVFHFATSVQRLDLDLVLVKKWPVTYAIAFTGDSTQQAGWQRLRDALPQSLQIK